VWAKQTEVVTFHDPLAAAVIFEPGLCGYRDGHVDVDTRSSEALGRTVFDSGATPAPHRVAVSVDPAAFFELYFSVVEQR
jgi:inosine-uridine nucleoside N-ribohydrolase